MKASGVVISNRLFDVINQPGDCCFLGPRFISKVREVDPYFPDYHQFLNDRNKTGKSTSKKNYSHDILLSLGEEESGLLPGSKTPSEVYEGSRRWGMSEPSVRESSSWRQ